MSHTPVNPAMLSGLGKAFAMVGILCITVLLGLSFKLFRVRREQNNQRHWPRSSQHRWERPHARHIYRHGSPTPERNPRQPRQQHRAQRNGRTQRRPSTPYPRLRVEHIEDVTQVPPTASSSNNNPPDNRSSSIWRGLFPKRYARPQSQNWPFFVTPHREASGDARSDLEMGYLTTTNSMLVSSSRSTVTSEHSQQVDQQVDQQQQQRVEDPGADTEMLRIFLQQEWGVSSLSDSDNGSCYGEVTDQSSRPGYPPEYYLALRMPPPVYRARQ